MISIIGDTSDELAALQSIIDTGVINSNEKVTVDVTYKLSSGDNLLINQYNHIVGSKPRHPCSDCPQGAECYGLFGGITEPRHPCEYYEKYKKEKQESK